MFNQLFKPSLKNDFFQRPKTRENLANGIFSDAKDSINWVNKILITLFFTPVVGITDILAKNSIIVLGSITVAIYNLTNYIYRLIQNDVSIIEILLNFFFICIAICIAIMLTPYSIPVIINFSSILFLINVAATGVNSYFLIRDVLVPPIYILIKELGFKLFGIKITGYLYKRKEFTLQDDYDVLLELTRKDYAGKKLENNDSDPETKETVNTYNKLLNKLVFYYNKYNQNFLGHVRFQSDIDQIDKIIKEVTINCKTSTAYEKIDRKITFKLSKIERLSKAKQDISKAASVNHLTNFNQTLRMYINMPCVWTGAHANSIREIPGAEKIACELISSEIERQKEKINSLQECLPLQKRRNYDK